MYRHADDAVYEAESRNRWKTAEKHRVIVERHHPKPGLIIDVGCGSGAFLRLMADHGWSVFGVEPSDSQYRRAEAILGSDGKVEHAILEEATLPRNADFITLWDVLEHVLSPVKFLEHCAALLSDNGSVALNVPRIDSLPAKLLRHRWPLLLAEHLNYFTIDGLRRAGRSAGLELVASGSRPVFFSLGYIFYRLAQHGLPGSETARQLISRSGIQDVSAPLWMGETYCIFLRR
jgi:SAM-dependent methyltransferase